MDLPILSNQQINTEKHLKGSLGKHGIQLQRGDAAFVRLCSSSSDSCDPLPILDSSFGSSGRQLYAKKSGGQIEVAKSELFKAALEKK